MVNLRYSLSIFFLGFAACATFVPSPKVKNEEPELEPVKAFGESGDTKRQGGPGRNGGEENLQNIMDIEECALSCEKLEDMISSSDGPLFNIGGKPLTAEFIFDYLCPNNAASDSSDVGDGDDVRRGTDFCRSYNRMMNFQQLRGFVEKSIASGKNGELKKIHDKCQSISEEADAHNNDDGDSNAKILPKRKLNRRGFGHLSKKECVTYNRMMRFQQLRGIIDDAIASGEFGILEKIHNKCQSISKDDSSDAAKDHFKTLPKRKRNHPGSGKLRVNYTNFCNYVTNYAEMPTNVSQEISDLYEDLKTCVCSVDL